MAWGDWIIWYADGSSFSFEDGDPSDAPRNGVICIAAADISCGHYIMAEQNFYCWHNIGGWVPHDRDGLDQYLDDRDEPGIRLRGYWVDRDRYIDIRRMAAKDPRLPPKTAGPPRRPEGE